MKTIKSIEYALMRLDAIKRDVRYYDESLRDSGMRYGDIAIVVELKGDGNFTHKVMCADWSLNEIALDAYKVVISQIQVHHFHLWLVSSVDSSASSQPVSTPKSAQPSSN